MSAPDHHETYVECDWPYCGTQSPWFERDDPDAFPDGWLRNPKTEHLRHETFRPRHLCPLHARYYRHAESGVVHQGELAEILGVSATDIYRMRTSFELPPTVPIRREDPSYGARAWWRGAIEEWMAERNWPEGRETRPTKPA